MMARLFALALMVLVPFGAAADCAPGQVDLRGDWGQTRFSVEVADDRTERARGLMFVEDMPAGTGMLFLYERPQRVSFWMKNTLIPLDLLFLDARGVVTRVHENAQPHDLTPIDGGEGVIAVLEINGGLAARYAITPGSEMRHPGFDAADAIWPCDDG